MDAMAPTTVVVTENEDLRMVTVAGEGQLRIRIEVEQSGMQMDGAQQESAPGAEAVPGPEAVPGAEEEATPTAEAEGEVEEEATPTAEAEAEGEATPTAEAEAEAEGEATPTAEAEAEGEVTPTAEAEAEGEATPVAEAETGDDAQPGAQDMPAVPAPGVEVTETEDGRVVSIQSTGRVHIAIDVEPSTATMNGQTGTSAQTPVSGAETQPGTQAPVTGTITDTETQTGADTDTQITVTPVAPETGAADVVPAQDDIIPGGIIEFSELEGFDVVNANGENVGSIGDLLINTQSGEILVAAVEFGGFLGLGTQVLPIPWESLRWDPNFYALVTDLPSDRLADPPGLDGDWPNLNDQLWIDEAEATWQTLGVQGPAADLRGMSGQLASVENMVKILVALTKSSSI
jgi:sporulation protein YlmC with PRC-barrel domain